MARCLLEIRIFAGLVVGILLGFQCASYSQEPSQSLKEADADYRSGVAALSSNDLETARGDFAKVVRLAPSAEQGHSALGAVLVRLGQINEGIRELEKALAIKANDSSAQLNLALALEQSGQPAKAIPWFIKFEATARIEKHPLSAEVLAAHARALAATHQFSAAAAKMKDAIAQSPRNPELHDELGSIYAQQKDWPNAQRAFDAALREDPNLAMAHLHLALSLQAEQQPGAVDEFTKAYQLGPQNPVIALEFGRFLAASGNDVQAIPVLRRAMELDPRNAEAPYQLGLALQRTNKVDEAIPLLQKAVAADTNDAEVLTNLGMALCQAQRAKEAVPLLQKAVSLTPGNPTAHQNLAASYIQLNQLDDAVSQLREALKLSPDSPQLHYNLGLAFKMQDDASAAIPEFEAAEKLDPTEPEPAYALGLLYLQAGRYEDAARELNASLKLRPENGDGWATLGSVYNNLGKLPEAVSALQEAIRQMPDQPDPRLTLAAVLVKQNQTAEATAERKKAADLMRANMNRQRAEVACHSGTSLLKDGKLDDAIVEFRNALSYDQNYTDAHLGLADALQRQGKLVEAAQERQKAQSSAKQP